MRLPLHFALTSFCAGGAFAQSAPAALQSPRAALQKEFLVAGTAAGLAQIPVLAHTAMITWLAGLN